MITLRKVRVNVERGYIEYRLGAAKEIDAALAEHGLGGSIVDERVAEYKGEPPEDLVIIPPKVLTWVDTKGVERSAEIAPYEKYER